MKTLSGGFKMQELKNQKNNWNFLIFVKNKNNNNLKLNAEK
jgi:hypothetical protein